MMNTHSSVSQAPDVDPHARPDPRGAAVANDYRSAIERELAERVAQRARTARPAAVVRPAPAARPAPTVALECLKCHAVDEADAQFCSTCGERFNARVITLRAEERSQR